MVHFFNSRTYRFLLEKFLGVHFKNFNLALPLYLIYISLFAFVFNIDPCLVSNLGYHIHV